MKKIFIGLVITLFIVIIVPLSVLGLVPVLSSLIGAGPKDLGIRISKEDSVKARAKSGTEIISIQKNDAIKDFTLVGRKNAEFVMDSAELTAHSNNRPWKNYPLKNLQIKIHNDGTIESSATLVISKAIPYVMGLGYSESQIRDAMQKYSIPPFEVPVYVLGKGSVKNDVVSVDAQEVKIGMIAVPGDIVSQANKEAEEVLNDVIQKHSDAFHAEEVSFANGKMTFKGAVPEKEYVLTE